MYFGVGVGFFIMPFMHQPPNREKQIIISYLDSLLFVTMDEGSPSFFQACDWLEWKEMRLQQLKQS